MDVYSLGESELIVGKALKDRRDDVVLATKFSLHMGQDPNQRGGSPRWAKRTVEDSLRGGVLPLSARSTSTRAAAGLGQVAGNARASPGLAVPVVAVLGKAPG
jgi:hypothetical protein